MSIARHMPRLIAFVLVLLFAPSGIGAQQPTAPSPSESTTRYSVTVSSVNINATPVDQPAPVYPERIKSAGIAGEVTVNIAVDEDGSVVSAKAASGHPLLRDSAVQAARQWTFEPPKHDGKPASARGTIVFTFSVEHADEEADEHADDEFTDGESEESQGFGVPDEGTMPDGVSIITDTYDPEKDLTKAIERARANPTSPDLQVELARAYYLAGKIDEAITAYRTALALKPDLEPAVIGLGETFRAVGRVDDEILSYQQALPIMPNSIVLLRNLGGMLAVRNRYTEAIPILDRLAGLTPDDANVAYSLGQCHFQLNHLEDADREFRRATVLEPSFAYALHSLGAVNAVRGRYDDAIDAYTRVLALKPPYPASNRVHRELAAVYIAVRRYDEAIEILEKVIAESPEFLDAYCQLSEALMVLERLDEARKILKRAFVVDPECRCALSFWAALNARLRKPEEAESSVRRLIELNPDDLYARANLVLALLDQKRFDEAIVEAKAIVAKEPAVYRWHLLLGNVYDRASRLPAAEVSYRKALSLAPDDAGVLNDVGYFLADNDLKLDEAIQMLRRANELMPRNGSLLDSLGWALMKAGKLDEAERCLDDAVTRKPESPAIQEHVGDLALMRGQIDKARKYWEKALTISTATPEQIARIRAKLAEHSVR